MDVSELVHMVPTFYRERKRKNRSSASRAKSHTFQQQAVNHSDRQGLVLAALADHERNADELLYQVVHEHEARQSGNGKRLRSAPNRLVQAKPPEQQLDVDQVAAQTGWPKASATRMIRYHGQNWTCKTIGVQRLRLLLDQPDIEAMHVRAADWCAQQQKARKAERERAASKRAASAKRIGPGKLRETLDWPHWLFQLALSHGLIKSAEDGRIEPLEADRAVKESEAIRAQALQFELLNVPSAAKEIGCSESIMRSFLADTNFTADGEGSFRFGTFSLYARHRIQDAAPALVAWQDQRKSASADKRKAASAKAARTRALRQIETTDATGAVQQRMLAYASIQDPLTRAATTTAAWADLVAVHADSLLRAASRARSPHAKETKRNHADELHSTKNTAMQLLAQSGRVELTFLDAHQIWLCDECRDVAYNAGVHPRDWCGHCSRCETSHAYSLISMEIDGVSPLLVPVPLALDWHLVERPNSPQSDAAAHQESELPPTRKQKQKRKRDASRSMLPLWMQSIRVEPRYGGIGDYDAMASDAMLRAYKADTAAERLQASIDELNSLIKML
jgi:hypothetical protein